MIPKLKKLTYRRLLSNPSHTLPIHAVAPFDMDLEVGDTILLPSGGCVSLGVVLEVSTDPCNILNIPVSMPLVMQVVDLSLVEDIKQTRIDIGRRKHSAVNSSGALTPKEQREAVDTLKILTGEDESVDDWIHRSRSVTQTPFGNN